MNLSKTTPGASKIETAPLRDRRRFAARSLRARWRIFMIVGMNLLILVVVGCATLITALEQRQAAVRLQTSSARQAEAAIHEATDDAQRILAYVGQTNTAQTLADPSALKALLSLQPSLAALSLVGPDGVEIAHAALDPAQNPPDWTQNPAWIAFTSGAAGDSASALVDGKLTIAVPVKDQGGALIGTFDPQVLWQNALSAKVGDRGYAYLVSQNGQRLAAGPTLKIDSKRSPAQFAVFKAARGGGSALRIYQGITGSWVLGRAQSVPASGYTVIVESPLSGFVLPFAELAVLWLIALLLAAITGEWLIRRVSRTVLVPLDVLSQGANAVTAGNYRYRVRAPAHTNRELGELITAFNIMIERLGESQRQIDNYTHQMQEIVDQRARELARKASQLEVAAEVSSKIATILDPRKLSEEVVELIRARFKVYHVSITQIDEKTGKIVPTRSVSGLPEVTVQNSDQSVVAWVARKGETLYVPDVTQEPRYLSSPALAASRCELAIPLKFGGQVIGVLNLESDHRDAFAKDEIAVLESLANEIAVSLHNAQVFNALETANRDLAQAMMMANQANMLKSRFLFNASHKLRTPLNSIIGYSETILSGMYGDIAETVLDRQRRILDNGRHLQALIEDMLDLSSIETGQLQLNRQWTNPAPLLDEVMNAARALAETGYADHRLALRLDLPPADQPLPKLWVDVDRVRYILINLLSNAVKFTESGEVVLSAEGDEREVRIHVRDTGPGIPDDDRRYLFEPFQHQRGSITSEGKGTGLGLPVARLLAMRHGGDLTVDSTPRQGSTFTLHLPLQPEGAPPQES